MTFTGNIDKNIILRPLLTSRRFSHQKNSQGRYSDFAPLSRHLPTLSNNDKGQWRHRRENNKGAYSCGTVGDFHSVPFWALHPRTPTFSFDTGIANIISDANVYLFFKSTKKNKNIKEKNLRKRTIIYTFADRKVLDRRQNTDLIKQKINNK